jgi:hypothetical protein
MNSKKRNGSPIVSEKEKDKRIQSPPQQQKSGDENLLANKSTAQEVSRNLGASPKILSCERDGGVTSGSFTSNHLPLFEKKTTTPSLASQVSQISISDGMEWKMMAEGPMKNYIEVAVEKIDGKDFKGSIPETEGYTKVYLKALKLDFRNYHGTATGFRGCPILTFRLKEPINIDLTFEGKENFSWNRKIRTSTGVKTSVIDCKVRGVRHIFDDGRTYNHGREEGFKWVRIEGAEYRVDEEVTRKWLLKYGELINNFAEEKMAYEPDSSDEEDEEAYKVPVHTGKYVVKMRIDRPIPQILPIDGRRIRIYYKGIRKQCNNCFEMGHMKRDCKERRKDWAEYVSSMMESTGFEPDLFGKWKVVVQDWRSKNLTEALHSKTQQVEERKELIDNIVGTLEQQKKACSIRKVGARDGDEITSNENREDEVVEVGEKTAETLEEFTLVQKKDKRTNQQKQSQMRVEQILSAVAASHLGTGKPGRPKKLTTKKAQPPKQKNPKKKLILAKTESQSEDDDEPPANK